MNDLLFLKKIDKTGSVEQKAGSDRAWSVQTQRNISRFSELVCSQQDNPGTSKSPHEIEKLSGSFAVALCCAAYAF